MKRYRAETPLILQDDNGEDIRIERGETVLLSDTQYAEVAAHVTLLDAEETVNVPPEEPPVSEEKTQEPEAEQAADKPKRGRKNGE